MITVENDYKPIVYEQHPNSHIYENQSELLQDYNTRPIRNDVSIEQNVNEINTVVNNEKQRSSTNHIYQDIEKKTAKRKKFGQSYFSQKTQNKKNFNHPILK